MIPHPLAFSPFHQDDAVAMFHQEEVLEVVSMLAEQASSLEAQPNLNFYVLELVALLLWDEDPADIVEAGLQQREQNVCERFDSSWVFRLELCAYRL